MTQQSPSTRKQLQMFQKKQSTLNMHLNTMRPRKFRRLVVFFVFFAFACSSQLDSQTPSGPPLSITTESLPEAYTGLEYRVQLTATGGIPPYKWSVAAGDLPQGLTLDPVTGLISGFPSSPEEAHFTIQAADSNQPPHSINKELTLPAMAPLVFEWVQPPRVQANRIDGSVRVANGSRNDYDITVIVVGINEIGRATALGYHRFALKAKSVGPDIPFGTTLPDGSYMVHADAVAEVADKKLITKQMLHTPAALKVAVNP
jgi:hypothetical protein